MKQWLFNYLLNTYLKQKQFKQVPTVFIESTKNGQNYLFTQNDGMELKRASIKGSVWASQLVLGKHKLHLQLNGKGLFWIYY